ncbi:hypothetical protein TL16_g10182 [Triparma laevis f. inornata]|uniref:Protein kinase domain-containing protein n=2 Tax=Triparma laevis TaxID=1534972 RepID=A0A9W7DSL3_9STRA|nr:hypothetical protein TrLO_g12185 [Triparma laevis f. longispina]GMH85288.1 hypothetical protein TL16_g10182 [Triparma laevis f. inornata]
MGASITLKADVHTALSCSINDVVGATILNCADIAALNEISPEVFQALAPLTSFIAISWSGVLSKMGSSPEAMRQLVFEANEFNVAAQISGKIKIRNPLDENYIVTQTIDGPVHQVVLLWNRIKTDPMIQRITESSYELRAQPLSQRWGLTFENDGGQDCCKTFMTEHVKHKIIHNTKNKTVFIVEDMRTSQHYAMKEVIIKGNLFKLHSTNEYDVLKNIYEDYNNVNLQGRTGIIRAPDIFHDLVRISMVYPLYPLDLFNAIKYNSALYKTEGFDEDTIVTFLAQLLEALLLMKKRSVVHRDIKPENICVDEDGNLVLIDFELAVCVPPEANSYTQPSSVIAGTSLYIAPETYRRLEYSSATDLWAVAMVACDLHSHELPWDIDEHMSLDMVGSTILIDPPRKPDRMSNALWALLRKIFVRSDERITVEEAMREPIFANYQFTVYSEAGKMMLLTPGNVFDRHDHLERVRELGRQESYNFWGYARTSSRDRFSVARGNNSSPVIQEHRNAFAQGFTSPMED